MGGCNCSLYIDWNYHLWLRLEADEARNGEEEHFIFEHKRAGRFQSAY